MHADPHRLTTTAELFARLQTAPRAVVRDALTDLEQQDHQARAVAANKARRARVREMAAEMFAAGTRSAVICSRLHITSSTVCQWRRDWEAIHGPSPVVKRTTALDNVLEFFPLDGSPLSPAKLAALAGGTPNQAHTWVLRLTEAGHIERAVRGLYRRKGVTSAPLSRAGQVLDAIAAGARTAADVARACGIGKRNAHAVLSDLFESGQVRRVSRGVYAVPVRGAA